MRSTLVIILILLAGGIVTFLTGRFAAQVERESLAHRAATIAASIDQTSLDTLVGGDVDLDNFSYITLKNAFVRIVDANDDIIFVYALGRRLDGQIFFYGDSEPSDSEDYSAPGDVYDEATEELKQSFEKGEVFVEGPVSDQWGTWISGLAPLVRANGSVAGVIGIDVAASEYYQTILVASMVPALVTLLALIVVLAWYRDARKRQELVRLKSRFLSVASHELRSPLAGIAWGLDSVLSKDLDPQIRTMVQRVRNAVEHVTHTVADVLDASRLNAGIQNRLQREAFDLAELIRDAVDALSLNAEQAHISIIFDKTFPHTFPFTADKEKIRRIFSNIIGNALKYSSPGGSITFGAHIEDGAVVISVADKGIGIPKSEQKNIFATYYRASNAEHHTAHGTGMGLYFTKQLVDLHNGTLWFESREGQGSTFFVKFPR